jgi:hypothetical protein
LNIAKITRYADMNTLRLISIPVEMRKLNVIKDVMFADIRNVSRTMCSALYMKMARFQ